MPEMFPIWLRGPLRWLRCARGEPEVTELAKVYEVSIDIPVAR
jgi:hypothetical protein